MSKTVVKTMDVKERRSKDVEVRVVTRELTSLTLTDLPAKQRPYRMSRDVLDVKPVKESL